MIAPAWTAAPALERRRVTVGAAPLELLMHAALVQARRERFEAGPCNLAMEAPRRRESDRVIRIDQRARAAPSNGNGRTRA